MERTTLEALSKTQLIAVHKAVHGFVGDTGRTSKTQYVDALMASDAEKVAAAVANVPQDETVRAVAGGGSKAESIAPDAAAAQLLAIVRGLAGEAINEQRVREIVDSAIADALTQQPARKLEITIDGTTRKLDEHTHKAFPTLLKCLAAGRQVWIAGPTGSGKTHGVEQAARVLGVPFFFNGAIDTEYKLTGFTDANGRIVSTAFREAFSNGGVYLFDEVDASLPSATLAFNAALSNGYADFPGGMVKRHEKFLACAAANTWGQGSTLDYVGRNKMDAAFLNRFVRIEWAYDEQLERVLSGNDDWTATVQSARKAAAEKGLKIVISPRDSINGAVLIAAGFTREDAIRMTFGAGLSNEQRANLGV